VETGGELAGVELQPGSSWVAVAWLADAARVDQPAVLIQVEQRVVAGLGAAVSPAAVRLGSDEESDTCECRSGDPLRLDVEQASACSRRARTPRRGRGGGVEKPIPRARPELELAQQPSVLLTFSRVQATASAAASENAAMSRTPSTARSWLPTRQREQRSRTSSAHRSGSAP
jgi:hypothetical protein